MQLRVGLCHEASIDREQDMSRTEIVRLATSDDLQAVAKLVNICYHDEVQDGITDQDSRESLEKILDRGNPIFVLVASDLIVGCVYVDVLREGIFKLAVAPGLRRKGFGRLLMEAAEIYARNLGWAVVLLGVIETKGWLVEYYARQGYRLTGERKEMAVKADSRPKLIIMEKAL
jgi:ribosomal protein S18 acetylase RimI-like enzyme